MPDPASSVFSYGALWSDNLARNPIKISILSTQHFEGILPGDSIRVMGSCAPPFY